MTEFSKRRLEIVNETKGAQDQQKLSEWKVKITAEVKKLEEYSYENKKKIKTRK